MSGVKKLIPLLDRVLIERIVAPTISVGGILLPESATKSLNEGIVTAVGPGRRKATDGELIPMNLKIGDNVMLPDYGGATVKLGDKEFHLYRDEEILGLIENP